MSAMLHTSAPTLALGRVTPRARRAACAAAPQPHTQRLSRSGAALPPAPRRAARARRGVQHVAPHAALLRRTVGASESPLDLTEENVEQVLLDARVELKQMFDEAMGMTGALAPPRLLRDARLAHAACVALPRRHVHAG